MGSKPILKFRSFWAVFLPFSLEHGHKTKSAILEMKMRSNQKVEKKTSFKIRFYIGIQPSVKDFEQNMCSLAFLLYPTAYGMIISVYIDKKRSA